MNQEESRIVEAMHTWGGGFVKALSACFYAADRQNIEKLKKAFPEYWDEYDKMSAPAPKTDPDSTAGHTNTPSQSVTA